MNADNLYILTFSTPSWIVSTLRLSDFFTSTKAFLCCSHLKWILKFIYHVIYPRLMIRILIISVVGKIMLLTFYHLIHEWASVRHSYFLNPLNPYKLQSHLTKDVSEIYQQSSVFDSWPMIYNIVIGAWYFF